MIHRLIYHFQKALQHQRNGGAVSVVSVLTILFSMFLLGGYTLLLFNLNQWISVTEERLSVHVFLKDNVNNNQTTRMSTDFKNIAGVQRVTYISKAQALQKFTHSHPSFQWILTGLDINPFPASFELSFKAGSRSSIVDVANRLKKRQGIEAVDYGAGWVERYSALVAFLKLGGYVVGAFALMCVIFVVSNTVRLQLYSRRDEIEIMQLVGGTRGFIASPFILESLLSALLGGLLSLMLLYAIFSIACGQLTSSTFESILGFRPLFLTPAYISLVVGLGLISAFLGSFVSLQQFLRRHES